jgi:hypothetical protein
LRQGQQYGGNQDGEGFAHAGGRLGRHCRLAGVEEKVADRERKFGLLRPVFVSFQAARQEAGGREKVRKRRFRDYRSPLNKRWDLKSLANLL